MQPEAREPIIHLSFICRCDWLVAAHAPDLCGGYPACPGLPETRTTSQLVTLLLWPSIVFFSFGPCRLVIHIIRRLNTHRNTQHASLSAVVLSLEQRDNSLYWCVIS